jgi:nucleotide-binding universal stress UspA family protein
MQGFDAVRAVLKPFSLAQRRKVPAGHGRGRQIVFAVDSSSFRFVREHARFFFSPSLLSRALTRAPPRPPRLRRARSEDAVRFGLDNVARGNDSVACACVYKKANLRSPDVGAFVDGVPVSSTLDERTRVEAERKDKARCESACARFVEDAKAAGIKASSAEILSCGASGGGGSVADVLERYVESTNADLLVVGSRGAGSSRGALLQLMGLGSVSEHLVRHAKTPVLVVKHHHHGASQTEVNKSTEKSKTPGKEDPREGLDADAEKKESARDARGDASRGDDDFLGPPEQGFAKGTR